MKIIMATGGSGGHIVPALKVAEKLKRDGHHVMFVGALSSAKDRLAHAGFEYVLLDVQGFKSKSIMDVVTFSGLMIKSIVRCLGILKSFRPGVVVGFGSYSSFPVLCAAWCLGIRSVIHEQNVIPGKANKLCAFFARKIAITFDESKKYFQSKKVVVTGCPCHDNRSDIPQEELFKKFGLSRDRITFFVMGGSQGSRYLNRVFFESIPLLQDQLKIQVIHLTGSADYETYKNNYPLTHVPHFICAFMDRIQEAYTLADFVVARAGALTVCELASFGIPAVLVPYPYAHGHQKANAQILEKARTAVVIDQNDLSVRTLVDAVEFLRKQKLTSQDIKHRLESQLINDPVEKLSTVILENS